MSRVHLQHSVLCLALTVALPAWAQSHAHHVIEPPTTHTSPAVDHASMDHASMDHSTMDHSTMDHSTMEQASMDHATADHSSADHVHPVPADQPCEPIPAVTAADRAAAFPVIDHGAMQHASSINHLLRVERLEQFDGTHGRGQAWEASGWIGGDLNRVWLRSRGERSAGRTTSSNLEVTYGRALTPWWDALAGVRQDVRPADSRTWLAVGVQGLAPYKFETSAMVYAGSGGQVLAEAEIEYEILLSNRLILQPVLETTLATRDEPTRGIGRGLSTVEAGLRLRYEFTRRFAPYIGISHERAFGNTAGYRAAAGDPARETHWVAGVRLWF